MVRLTSRWFCGLLMVTAFQISFAQPANRQIVNQSIEWIALTTNLKVTQRATVLLEGQFRQAQDFQPMQYQLRTGVDFSLNKHFSFMPLGYVYTWNFRYGKQPAAYGNNEHRIYQQITYKHHISRVSISHRLRLEQRFIQVHTRDAEDRLVNQGYDLNQNRLRYRFMATVPLNHSKVEPKTYFATVYDEAFLSWGENVTFHEPDQNRLFVGAGYQFSNAFALQGGFLYQMLIKANGAMQENNVGVQVQLTYNIDLTKK
ncbi:MAG TPA: DUF2490 domain-containing protein [Ohtaekwangia sp.]|uniref:DUF2490 domain-containing protein n=1 Tax=Ohtaekwangia sp. TaxID=2066019 RepID=UPI002F942273